MITTNQKPRFTVPATILPHAIRGLGLLKKVSFEAPHVKSAGELIPRFHDLTTKPVAEHRTRMTLIDAAALKAGLKLQAEWLVTGRKTVDSVIPETIDRLDLFLAGKPVPSLPKAAAVVSSTETTATTETTETTEEILSAGVAADASAASAVTA